MDSTHFPLPCRRVYEEAVEALGEFAKDEKLFVAFAKFEERQKEYERARAIFRCVNPTNTVRIWLFFMFVVARLSSIDLEMCHLSWPRIWHL